jgi:hypothetical protein
MTMINYWPSVTRSSLPLFAYGLVMRIVVVLAQPICDVHVCFIYLNVSCLSFVFV